MHFKEILITSLAFLALTAGCMSEKITVKTTLYQVPVLTNKTDNPVLKILLRADTHDSISVSEVSISLEGTTDLNDLSAVRLFYSATQSEFITANQYGKDQKPSMKIKFSDEVRFKDSCNLWVSLELNSEAELLHKISISCVSVKSSEGRAIPREEGDKRELRIGYALRKHMDDDVDTYRIPGITTTKQGTLIAVYDARRRSSRDLQGDIDVGMSRSCDGGKTWEPMKIVLDMGKWGGLPEKFNGVSDPGVVADDDNYLFITGLWMHGVLDENGKWIEGLTDSSEVWNHQWKNKGSQPGFGVKETTQFVISHSSDDGVTWSDPAVITTMVKKREWWLIAPTPGHGITLRDGTIVLPSQGRDEKGSPFSTIIWSRDNGVTWHTGKPAYHNTTENMAVELSNGSIMLNMRLNSNRNNLSDNNGRAVAVTKDLGESWTEHPTSRGGLPEPVCMASIHKHYYTVNGVQKEMLLFSNPNSKTKRENMTLKVSFDDGMTWPEKYWILLDEMKSRGYSCITSVNENEIAVLYESSQADLVFEKIPLSDIINK